MRKTVVTGAVAMFGLLASAPAAWASDTVCTGFLPAGTYDNILVPPGAVCNITGSTVHNVTAREDSVLFLTQSVVNGNVAGQKADGVEIDQTTVTGTVTITGGGPRSGEGQNEAVICGSTIRGDIKINHTTGSIVVGGPECSCSGGNIVTQGNVDIRENVIPATEALTVQDNDVSGNVMVNKNTGDGAKSVQTNIVGNNLQCSGNAPVFVGGPQTSVGGSATGQCSIP